MRWPTTAAAAKTSATTISTTRITGEDVVIAKTTATQALKTIGIRNFASLIVRPCR